MKVYQGRTKFNVDIFSWVDKNIYHILVVDKAKIVPCNMSFA